ncbi:twin-arginine translocase TatA/TatE family subunit [Daejeonella sp. JGW-45]|uniref:twin-arginine translocase TatA/TatE family subunit n=1 Tax=Daejeonella sp. JGW-45 TaxID=3034148 RepID=UPI0023ED6C40|nr:twin-arginine translocase TatA/TatE family subunit [Daejeonella sp. JGW-45]
MYSSILLFMNIGGPEMILIFLVVLLLFGGKKLPELARGLGKGLREFKDASDGIKREIHNNINTVTEATADMDKDIAQATYNVDPESPDYAHGTEPEGSFKVDPEAPAVTESGLSDKVSGEETKIAH